MKLKVKGQGHTRQSFSNQQKVGHSGAQIEEELVDRCKLKFSTIWGRDMGLSYAQGRF